MVTVSLQTVFDDARRAIETGAADKAIGIAQHILVHFPHTIEGSRLLGEAYLNAGQPEQAAAAFSQVLKADPENVAAYYGEGLALQSMEQRPAAITCFERALEIQPNLADLRTQLMRLYAETPGSAGQFRLSRAGLGRLYARGGMFSQAIDEFRAVLDADPDRNDVKVALAEALWRDGQEDEAMDYCRDLLERQPELLKPTVLLGYMLFASGQPAGETLWRRAAAQDVTMALPRTLFDILPPIRIEEPVIPEFDEAEWRAQEARRAGQAQQAPAAATAPEAEEDIFADSWLSSAGSAAVAASSTARIYDAQPVGAPVAAQAVGGDDDDLLASLLGFDMDEPAAEAAPAPTDAPDVADVEPFSFDDWDAPSPSRQQTQSDALPRSLDDLGLEDDQPRGQADADIGAVKPFSLDDWSFDDEPERPANTAAPATTRETEDFDLGNVEAFSLDEPASPSPASSTAGGAGNVQPFTLDFDDEPTSGVQPFSLDDDAPRGDVRPFSLEDDAAPAGSVRPFSFDDDDLGVAPFSFEDERPAAPAPNVSDAEAGLGDVQPFSLDEWGLDDDTPSEASAPPVANASRPAGEAEQAEGLGDFKPFSLDDLALDALDDDSAGALNGPRLADFEESSPEPATFNWEEPTWRAAVTSGSEGEAHADESIFAKLMRNRPAADQASSEEPAPSDVPAEEDQHFFSLDDESLRLALEGIDQNAATTEFDDPMSEEQHTSPASQPQLPAAPSADVSQQGGPPERLDEDATLPFSLDELAADDESFSWETTSQPAAETSSDEGGNTSSTETTALPFSLEELTADDGSFSWETEQPAAQTSSEEMVPFSLSELGLSDDDLTALNELPELNADVAHDTDSELAPFSLAELGLSDDEIAGLNLADAPGTADESPALTAESDTQPRDETLDRDWNIPSADVASDDVEEKLPFSIAELGLTDDEIALLSAEPAQAETAGASSGREQEDFDAMLSGMTEWEQPTPNTDGDVPADEGQSEWLELQAELDVDLPATRTPDDFLMEAKVTDGDVQSVLETMPSESADDDVPGMTSFSLADLGLNDEELALFDQGTSDQNENNQPYPAPDDAAPPSPFADTRALEGLFAADEPGASVDEAEGSDTFQAEQPEAAGFSQDDAVAPLILDDELASAELAGQEPEQALPADLPEGAQPFAAIAEAPVSGVAPAPETEPQVGGDGGDAMTAFLARLAADPENDALRLAVARMSQSMNDSAQAYEQYRLLIKRGRLLEEVVVDLQDTIAESDDPQMLRRLHRLLGDAYMKQNRIREAMDEYSWTLPRRG